MSGWGRDPYTLGDLVDAAAAMDYDPGRLPVVDTSGQPVRFELVRNAEYFGGGPFLVMRIGGADDD